ncbi:MAG TPA: hypothetical protein VFB74_19860, partial [Kribbellaceae bacterium]|nr:hypothetical protein [Kribbellaceae bacterium]
MTRTFDAVGFDLDDTLLDHTGSATAAVRGWVTELGGTPPDATTSSTRRSRSSSAGTRQLAGFRQ